MGGVKTVQAGGFDLDVGFQVLLSAYPLAQRYLDMEALNLRQLASERWYTPVGLRI